MEGVHAHYSVNLLVQRRHDTCLRLDIFFDQPGVSILAYALSLLGVLWKNIYVDAMLPFELRSASKIFTAVADDLEWCFRKRGMALVEHYLDDFVTKVLRVPTPASPIWTRLSMGVRSSAFPSL